MKSTPDDITAIAARALLDEFCNLPIMRQFNPVLRGWCKYFRHGVSSATFG